MDWTLSSEFTIEDTKAGFLITLLSSSWLEPADIKANAPNAMTIRSKRYICD